MNKNILMLSCLFFTSAAIANTSEPEIKISQGQLKCENKNINDLWPDARLGCAKVGEQFIRDANLSDSKKINDTSYTLGVKLVDSNFNTANNGYTRYYEKFFCVKNIPMQTSRTGLTLDIGRTLGIMGNVNGVPGIVFSSVTLLGGDTSTTCDPNVNPIIVDYRTGKINSINPQALRSIKIYQKKDG